MKKEEIIGNVKDVMGDGKNFPSTLERDLNDCAMQLERVKGESEQIDEIMGMDRFRRLRDRIKSEGGLPAAREFERCLEELKK